MYFYAKNLRINQIIIIIIIITLSGAYLNGTSKYAINQKWSPKEKAPQWKKKKKKIRTTKNQGDRKQKTDTITKPKQSILGKKKE